ncbi:MAG: sel1 repeat family protein, partial [Methylovulum sp.]
MTEQNTLSISELQQQANAGDAQAQFDLACRLAGRIEMVSSELWPKFYESLRDFLGDEDYDTATILIWLTKAAEQGLVSAQLALGLHYLRGINQDLFDKAKKSLDANKNTDTEGATLFTSLCIENGKNANLAFTWLKNAAEQNCTEAQYLLAVCYQDGIGIKQNYELAFAWFDKLAAQGFAAAQCDLARAYHEGKGVEQNNELALAWLNKAVEQTDAHIATADPWRLALRLSRLEHIQQFPHHYPDDHSKYVPEAYILMGEL